MKQADITLTNDSLPRGLTLVPHPGLRSYWIDCGRLTQAQAIAALRKIGIHAEPRRNCTRQVIVHRRPGTNISLGSRRERDWFAYGDARLERAGI